MWSKCFDYEEIWFMNSHSCCRCCSPDKVKLSMRFFLFILSFNTFFITIFSFHYLFIFLLVFELVVAQVLSCTLYWFSWLLWLSRPNGAPFLSSLSRLVHRWSDRVFQIRRVLVVFIKKFNPNFMSFIFVAFNFLMQNRLREATKKVPPHLATSGFP